MADELTSITVFRIMSYQHHVRKVVAMYPRVGIEKSSPTATRRKEWRASRPDSVFHHTHTHTHTKLLLLLQSKQYPQKPNAHTKE